MSAVSGSSSSIHHPFISGTMLSQVSESLIANPQGASIIQRASELVTKILRTQDNQRSVTEKAHLNEAKQLANLLYLTSHKRVVIGDALFVVLLNHKPSSHESEEKK